MIMDIEKLAKEAGLYVSEDGKTLVNQWVSPKILKFAELYHQSKCAKVASAEMLVEALREAKDVVGKHASDESKKGWIFIDAYKKITEALATYDTLSEEK